MVKNQDYTLGLLTHILSLFTWILGPLVVYLATEDEFAKKNARTSLNWQLSYGIYCLISVVLMFILIGFLTLAAVSVLNIVFSIIAAVKAADGKVWVYPAAIPFFKE